MKNKLIETFFFFFDEEDERERKTKSEIDYMIISMTRPKCVISLHDVDLTWHTIRYSIWILSFSSSSSPPYCRLLSTFDLTKKSEFGAAVTSFQAQLLTVDRDVFCVCFLQHVCRHSFCFFHSIPLQLLSSSLWLSLALACLLNVVVVNVLWLPMGLLCLWFRRV